MKSLQLINVKMPTIVGILTFISGKNSILGLNEHEQMLAEFLDIFHIKDTFSAYMRKVAFIVTSNKHTFPYS